MKRLATPKAPPKPTTRTEYNMTADTIDFIYNALGIIGVGLIVIGFFLIQTGKIASTDLVYPLLNFAGALLHLVSLYRFYNLASVIIEIFWIAISVYGLIKVFEHKKAAKRKG